MSDDLTIILLTANKIPATFFQHTFNQLLKAAENTALIVASKKPVVIMENSFEYKNIIFDTLAHHVNIYADALNAARHVRTKYLAIAEDDTLYSPEHFKYRPKDEDAFAYNIGTWGLYTWVKPAIFNWRTRHNHNGLICRTDLYIETLQERFNLYKNTPIDEIPLESFAEPGRYEGNLGLTQRKIENFMTDPANIMFSHVTGQQHANLGVKKRMGKLKALEIPYWGTAEDILKMYE